jgi:hypothetical protein
VMAADEEAFPVLTCHPYVDVPLQLQVLLPVVFVPKVVTDDGGR